MIGSLIIILVIESVGNCVIRQFGNWGYLFNTAVLDGVTTPQGYQLLLALAEIL